VISGRQGQSAADGAFEIDSVPTGTQEVSASKAGYFAPGEVDLSLGGDRDPAP
jgi:hypothetical protein